MNSTLQLSSPDCPAACRGCSHRGLSFQESEIRKIAWLRRRLQPWESVIRPLVAVSEDRRWQYRDRVKLDTSWQDGHWQFGLRSGAELVPIPRCPVQSQRVCNAISRLAAVLPAGPDFPMAFYVQSGAQITLILKTHHRPTLSWASVRLALDLREIGVEGLWLNLHPCAGRRLFAKRGWVRVLGQEMSVDGSGLIYGPSSFRQLLPGLFDHALDRAAIYLRPDSRDSVLDLYCGCGSSLRRWAGMGAQVLGLEVDGEAVSCAQLNTPEALVLRGTCTQRLPQLAVWTSQHATKLVFANPPRTGLEADVLDWLANTLRPRRMAYLSCSAGTLSRDLHKLCGCGYRVDAIVPYDFFPHTHHVECLTLLQQSAA